MDSRERFDNMKTIWILIGAGVTLFWMGVGAFFFRLSWKALVGSSFLSIVGTAWFGSWLERQDKSVDN